VIITIFAPICGAHFNPTVSLVMAIRGNLDRREALAYMLVQIVGGCLGALFAHLMSAWIRFSSVLLSEPGCRNGSPSSSPPSGS
jgi:glycerol uptake facilitator-like aquaporin